MGQMAQNRKSRGRICTIPCTCSADPRFWGPRFFLGKNRKSQRRTPALGFGSASLGKNRRPQRRRSALRLLRFGAAFMIPGSADLFCRSAAFPCHRGRAADLQNRSALPFLSPSFCPSWPAERLSMLRMTAKWAARRPQSANPKSPDGPMTQIARWPDHPIT